MLWSENSSMHIICRLNAENVRYKIIHWNRFNIISSVTTIRKLKIMKNWWNFQCQVNSRITDLTTKSENCIHHFLYLARYMVMLTFHFHRHWPFYGCLAILFYFISVLWRLVDRWNNQFEKSLKDFEIYLGVYDDDDCVNVFENTWAWDLSECLHR